ncbi:rdgB/HAM1 family non-canonical purine NTP pyrophosphatase [Vavraia culicis subsp. floridensis]|uniref:RdgB/HAM1 family non-canonical purine NTP pyrophosphatase n=1 Tax=Vavraia culicis (isolate floridensis) TaxID=948595 RepID=L2GUA4_VAVCU|nr:rdgB/HAM1 family non-canonical purine NTP pyrophosphatase [Vavraia culicis subsp. floridensis]ELA47219.1 rdgB/HAM1 family non-canonical purine NTP pyrophosphatase [Vavraia culicis subsp. floridensis]
MKLHYFSSNAEKYEEIRELLPFPLHHKKVKFTKEQSSLKDIVLRKLKQLKNLYPDDIILVDSFGLELEGLHGLPGPYVEAFLNMGYENIENIVQKVGRKARAKNVLGLSIFESVILFEGICDGQIVEARGTYSTGFDRIFMVDRDCCTLAEHVFNEKKVISPRGCSVFYLVKYCERNQIIRLFS